ncbi:methyltransferase domain-containing protein [Brachybacterium huguangmaarense]
MHCHHFDAGTCRSCTLLDVPRARQVGDARARIEALLAPFVESDAAQAAGGVWDEPVLSADAGFRNRAKMVVTGTASAPVLGIQGQGGAGRGGPAQSDDLLGAEDLADCPLYPPGVEALLDSVRTLIRRAQVPPYDVARRRGEIRFVHVTIAPGGRTMLRLVLRSEKALDRIREHLPRVLEAHPHLAVVTANIHPEHSATLEGPTEIPLAGGEFLPITMGPVTLHARPRSFLQTNTAVAGELYAQVAAWVGALAEERAGRAASAAPLRLWDLYCGAGGFSLACAQAAGTRALDVTGVEVSEQAIVSAREAAALAGVDATFLAADATAWAEQEAERAGEPDVVVVNPPRRGLGERLATWIEGSGVPDVIYSSCNPDTLAADLAVMGSYAVVRGRLVDMFPHTAHDEVVVRLRRRDGAARPEEIPA